MDKLPRNQFEPKVGIERNFEEKGTFALCRVSRSMFPEGSHHTIFPLL